MGSRWSGSLPSVTLAFALGVIFCAPAGAQEIEPRTYVNAPVGLNFVATGYLFQTGNVFLDPSLPIEDVNADVHIAFVRYLRTLTIGGKPAKIAVIQPFTSGHWGV